MRYGISLFYLYGISLYAGAPGWSTLFRGSTIRDSVTLRSLDDVAGDRDSLVLRLGNVVRTLGDGRGRLGRLGHSRVPVPFGSLGGLVGQVEVGEEARHHQQDADAHADQNLLAAGHLLALLVRGGLLLNRKLVHGGFLHL